MSYQNIGFNAGQSKFAKVLPSGPNDELSFSSRSTAVPVTGGKVNMVSASVVLNHAKDVTISTEEGAPRTYVNESLKISYNIVKGSSADFDALEAEVLRVLAIARAQYNLDNGLVPSANATFPEA